MGPREGFGSQSQPWLQGTLGNEAAGFPAATEQGGDVEGGWNEERGQSSGIHPRGLQGFTVP